MILLLLMRLSMILKRIGKCYLCLRFSQWQNFDDTIMDCVSPNFDEVYVNGYPTTGFYLENDLCHVNPLSLFLFLIIVEGLHSLSLLWLILGYFLNTRREGIIIMDEKSWVNIRAIKFIFLLFELMSKFKGELP